LAGVLPRRTQSFASHVPNAPKSDMGRGGVDYEDDFAAEVSC
jgi:hypothetical protein